VRELISNLLTLPYRMIMLGMGYMMWCDKCNTIVSGGFGYKEHNENKFMCGDCANNSNRIGKNRVNLSRGAARDPNKKESK